jgi:hypothetical protein
MRHCRKFQVLFEECMKTPPEQRTCGQPGHLTLGTGQH